MIALHCSDFNICKKNLSLVQAFVWETQGHVHDILKMKKEPLLSARIIAAFVWEL
jgi:hypothetical protein